MSLNSMFFMAGKGGNPTSRIPHPNRPGYVLLLSVLSIGVIAATTVASLLLLGGAAEKTAWSVSLSLQALENARTCAERGMLALLSDPTYAGGETFTLTKGTCEIRPIGGAGNARRTLCAQGERMGSIRRLEVRMNTLFPRVGIDFWREASAFTLCP